MFGDALLALKANLVDPNYELMTWEYESELPCGWQHVLCNAENRVTRIVLGNANFSGQLVPELGQLQALEYLILYNNNNISGRIPNELGNLTNLVHLQLNMNNLNGPIPSSLGRLQKLSSLRLDHNSLSGHIPMSLTTIQSLQVLDLSNNNLTGPVPVNGSFHLFTPISFANNQLDLPQLPPLVSPTIPSSSPVGKKATIAIAVGLVAGAALNFVVW